MFLLEVLTAKLDEQTDKTFVTLPNDELDAELREVMAGLATSVGIDFEQTGFTFAGKRAKNGRVYVSRPTILANETNDGLVLRWGNVLHPVAYSEVGVYSTGTLEYKEQEFPVMYKEKPEDLKKLAKALKAGKLHELMYDASPNSGGNFSKKLKDVAPGTYTITEVGTEEAFGRQRYYLVLEGVGKVASNTSISNQLEAVADLDEMVKLGATLSVGVVEQYTQQGHPIVPAKLLLPAGIKRTFNLLSDDLILA